MISLAMEKRLARTINAIALVGIVALTGACASSQQQDLPQVDKDGLELVKDTRHSAAYVDPDADFSEFNRVTIADVEVAFRKNWLRDQNDSRASLSRRVTQEDADNIKAAVAQEFTRVFTEELENGGYEVVDFSGFENSASDLLVLAPAIVNLDVTAPDTMSPGRSRTYAASTGSMTLYLEFHDSISGALLGRFVEAKAIGDTGTTMQISNSVTNKADADREFRQWAKRLVAKLDEVHGK
jgi:hypothetical protein